MKEVNKIRVATKFARAQIQCRDEYPTGWSQEQVEERQMFKYYCPICLRYFNHILISNCCNNYICRHCIGQQANKARKDPKYVINCSHCYQNEFRLDDVTSENGEPIKHYTDTPFKYLERKRPEEETPTPPTPTSFHMNLALATP